MNRPWQIGVAFALCLAVVLAAMGWISLEVLRLDRAEAEARRHALQEENVRLALWRMESSLAPLVAQESARPYFVYSAFYSAERAYERMFNPDVSQKRELFLPSPLLVQTSPYILLHFQLGPTGDLTSPQVPVRRPPEPDPVAYTTREAIARAAARLDRLRTQVGADALAAALSQEPGRPPPPQGAMTQTSERQPPQQMVQQERNVKEWQARTQTFQGMNVEAQTQSKISNRLMAGSVAEGVMKPMWFGEALVLARRVTVGGQEYLQGAWLDWPALRQWLLAGVKDLAPSADLVPVRDALQEDRSRMLAALPVRLVPGTVPAPETAETSPVALSLAVAWGCVLLAAAAVGLLLWGTVALSERRGDFVSAVTHELRTPLTTFRMYSEMLAEGMVTDDQKRRRYLATLRVEALRLSHLVENVLAYARLERGRVQRRVEIVPVGDLVARLRDRLAERAAQARMELVIEAPEDNGLAVKADASAVEQIVFNLVDNACKYAAAATDKRIHLVAGRADGGAVLKVCDHGPGISAAAARRLFRPFSKSSQEAANSAPGVGLGLALSRRLARDMGGDLRLELQPAGGACFVLSLPCA
ncbi:MAG: HAMP domain-containing sensor histidine kinase [Planctomycetota bacterium]|nr:HAMP domain-containing sensor histidine kinase [Planctomycetota bacterium]